MKNITTISIDEVIRFYEDILPKCPYLTLWSDTVMRNHNIISLHVTEGDNTYVFYRKNRFGKENFHEFVELYKSLKIKASEYDFDAEIIRDMENPASGGKPSI